MYPSSTLHFLFIFNIYTGTKRFVTQFNTMHLCIRRASQLNAHWKGLDTYSAEVPYTEVNHNVYFCPLTFLKLFHSQNDCSISDRKATHRALSSLLSYSTARQNIPAKGCSSWNKCLLLQVYYSDMYFPVKNYFSRKLCFNFKWI